MSRFVYESSDELKTMYMDGWVTLTVYNVMRKLEKQATQAELTFVRSAIARIQAINNGTCRSIEELPSEAQRIIHKY